MNCKRSLYGAAILAAVFAVPVQGFSQAGAPPASSPPAPAAQAAPRITEGIVAVVNDSPISTLDLREQMVWLSVTTGVQPTAQNRALLMQRARDELIDEHLKYQELIRRLKMTSLSEAEFFATDAEVDELLSKLAEQNNRTLDQFLGELKSLGVSPQRLRRQYKINLSWDRFFQDYYGRKVRISESDVKSIQNQISAASAAPRYRLGEIFVDSARAGSVQAAVTAAGQILEQLQQGARFEDLALRFSSKPTAATGGTRDG